MSRRDPLILSILIFIDLVAAARLGFPVVCTDASLLSNCSAHVSEMLLYCSAFASLDRKSLVASSHFHSCISSISSTKESHNHSSKVWFQPASIIFLGTSPCRMHLSACSNNSCVSIAIGSVLSLPACVFGKSKRALAVDRGKCQVFFQAWTHNHFPSLNSFSENSMSAAEKRKTPISFACEQFRCSGVREWQLISHVLQRSFA